MKKVLLLLLFANALMAQPSYHFDLLKDINTTTNDANIKFIKNVGNKIVIFQQDKDYITNTYKLRIWSYDGTTLKNFASMGLSHDNAGFTKCTIIDNYIFFHIDNEHPFALYVVKLDSPDIRKVINASYPPKIVKTGTRIYYSDHMSGVYYYNELTNESTKIQPENVEFFSPGITEATGGLIYFNALDYDYPPYILYTWVSDGTPEGTHKLKDATQQTILGKNMRKFGNRVIFKAYESLYISDGTQAGTYPFISLSNFKSNPTDQVSISEIFGLGNKAFLLIRVNANYQLWVTDGTAANTRFVTFSGGFFYDADLGVVSKDEFVFITNDNYQLLKTDGNTVKKLSELSFYYEYEGTPRLIKNPFDNSLYFNIATKFYKTDGTTEGTQFITDKLAYAQDSRGRIPFGMTNNRIFAYGIPKNNNRFGREIYEVNADTIKIVKDLDSTTKSAEPLFLLNANGKSYFTANDGGPAYLSFFETDGTPEGTKKIEVGNLGSSYRFFVLNKDLFLLSGNQLKKINTSTNTSDEIKTFSNNVNLLNPVQRNNKAYFVVGGAGSGEIWVTDGTNAGTVKLSTFDVSDTFIYAAVHNQQLYFFTKSVNTPNTLSIWKLTNDATPPVLLKTFNGSSIKTTYSNFRNKLAFLIDATDSMELWVTDGTSGGTSFQKSFPPRSNLALKNFYFTTSFIYYSEYTPYTDKRAKVWRTDGTSSGTTLIADLTDVSNDIYEFCECNNAVFFNVDKITNSSTYLYKQDNTNNTSSVLNRVGSPFDFRRTLYCLKNQLYFFGYGNQTRTIYDKYFLYTSDGTSAGTKDAFLIDPRQYYTSGDFPAFFYPLNDQELLANFNDTFYNSELFTFRRCDNPTNLTGTTADSKIQSSATFIESSEKLTGDGRVYYFAPKSITLKAGFSVDNTSVFRAEIKNRPCTLRQ
ncbi:3-coathanger stack domain-containing protein [Emticicia sp. C21]|uniref:3-coathanger stack domain-containing protein n=1 Tax=Emticicia sp. C21 TaxID=2302915 RepID=UPI0011C15F7E|nr:3-coathanger stack domain-containing protein [Emticicia sp. C21]